MGLKQSISKISHALFSGILDLISGAHPNRVLDSRRAFGLILGIAVAGLGLSGFLVARSIHLTHLPAANVRSSSPSAIAKLDALKTKDTDGDGLSDYDELFHYHTSPYLKDSDSDGIPDNVEIKNGTDPNCPQGKICSVAASGPLVDTAGNPTPAFLRQALLAAGVPEATISQVSDDQLLTVYRSVVQGPGSNSNSGNTNAAPSLDNLSQLTPAQIRQLLTENGVDQSSLNSVDDQTLKQIFDQGISNASTNTNK